jgi:polyisoprenyl-teichoic acid--peptidoglycan teichoic acid transferase
MNLSWQPRAFLQRFVLALVLVSLFTATGIGMAYWIAADKIDSAKTAKFDPGTLDEVGRGQPANFLIIGSDTRAFVDNAADEQHFGDPGEQAGQRSDTIMIAHIDPDHGTGLLVSFPRDLWVRIPGKGGSKINAAFNAGPQRVVETIQQNFQIPINHYLEIDFSGFRNIVDAIGNVPIYFPAPARDKQTGLLIETAGCHRLDGAAALAYARSREYEYVNQSGEWVTDGTADLGRIRRQQYFIRSLANEAVKTGFRNFTKINDILNKTVDNITRDPDLGLSDLRALAKTFRNVDPKVVEMVTVPTKREFISGQDAQVLVDSEAAPIFQRLRSFSENETNQLPAGVAAGDVRAVVLNGSGVAGQARVAFDALRSAGFGVVDPPANADRSDYQTTEVRYAKGAEDQARFALAYLGGAGKLVQVDRVPKGANVVIVLGRDFEQVTAPATTAPGAAATSPTTVAGPPTNPNPGGGDAPLPASGC